MKRLLLIFVFYIAFLCVFESYAFEVRGRLLAEYDSIPVSNASCRLIDKKGEIGMSTSDSAGGFSIQTDSIYTEAIVRISADGYDEYSIMISSLDSNVDVGDCFMTKTSQLEEFVVEGKEYRHSKGKLLITPSAMTVKNSRFAVDLLSKLSIPGLEYNPIERNIKVSGEIPIILINGVPSTIDRLKSLNASDVQNVEFTNNVPPIYSSLGSSMISVTLKQKDNGGSITLFQLNDFIGDDDSVLDMTYHHGPSQWRAFYSFQYRHYAKVYDFNNEKYTSSEMPIDITMHGQTPFLYRTHNAALEYVYNPNKSFILQTRLTLYADNNLQKQTADIDDSEIGRYNYHARSYMTLLKPNLDIFASKTFGEKNNVSLNVVGGYGHTVNSESKQYEGYPGFDLITNNLNSNQFSLISAIQYSHNFSSKSILALSYTNSYSTSRNEYPLTGNSFDVEENINYLYAQYQLGIGPVWISLKDGVRFFHINDAGIVNSQVRNVSELNVSWNISNAFNLQSRTLYSPLQLPLNLIIDNPMRVSPYLVSNGNPDAKRGQSISENITVQFNKGIFSANFSAAYQHLFDFPFIIREYSDKWDCYLSTLKNGSNYNSVNLRLYAAANNILGMFDISGEISYNHYYTRYNDWRKHFNSVGGNISVAWNYKKWQIQYYRRFPLKNLDSFTLSSEESYDALNVNFRPIDNMLIGLEWCYMFNRKGWNYQDETISPQYLSLTTRQIHDNINWIRINFSYTFNFGTMFKSKRQRDINLEYNQSTFNKLIK